MSFIFVVIGFTLGITPLS